MSRTIATRPTYTAALQEIVKKYREAGQPWPANKRDIAGWAYSEGLWHPSRRSVIDELAKDIGRAMGVEYMTDPQGRRIRSKHARRVEVEVGGEMVQQTLWDDITTATPEHMQMSFQQRRLMMLHDNHQHKTDVESYNQNWNTGDSSTDNLRIQHYFIGTGKNLHQLCIDLIKSAGNGRFYLQT